MSATVTERRAYFQELLRLSGMFKQNVALKHGLPMPTTTELEAEAKATETPPAKPVVTPGTDNPPQGVRPAPTSGLPAWVKPALAAGAIALSGTGIGGALSAWLLRGEPAPIVQSDRDGSLLQWLEDNGQNVPPEWEQ